MVETVEQKVDSKEESELLRLLKKNSETLEGLTLEEEKRALYLIENPEYTEGDCWFCDYGGQKSPAIHNIRLCQDCSRYCLALRK